MSSSQPRPKVVIPVTVAILAGFLGAGIYGALTFGGTSAAPAQPSTVTVQQAAATASAVPTATVTKTVTVKVTPKPVTKTVQKPAAKVNAVTAQDAQPTDPAPSDTTTADAPAPVPTGGGRDPGMNYTPGQGPQSPPKH